MKCDAIYANFMGDDVKTIKDRSQYSEKDLWGQAIKEDYQFQY